MKEREEAHDRELGDALREALPVPPADAVDWSALHGRIVACAAPLLAGRRTRRANVWQTLSGWAAGAVPLTAAAAAAVLVVLSTGLHRGRDNDGAANGVATVEEALVDDLFAGSAPLLIASATDEALLDALLFYEEER